MKVPTIFKTCRPREDVLRGAVTESDFAADLAQVVAGRGSKAYSAPELFFANTHPTRGLRNLLANVCRRLSGVGGEVASIFRLDTAYGGGKTHGLIALVHAASGMEGVSDVGEFVDKDLIPRSRVRIAAFDGVNADPSNGRLMGSGIRAYTPWGEIAYSLAGNLGYDFMRKSDERHVAPGADTLRELFGGQPALILLDELSIYLRKLEGLQRKGDQLVAFLSSLIQAVQSSSNAALVYTLAVGKDGHATDSYGRENQFIYDKMEELRKVSARTATLLNPTEEDETVLVLRRRLFEFIDDSVGSTVASSYRDIWVANQGKLSEDATRAETVEMFSSSYPLHPEVMQTLTGKVATLEQFQRVRGMLRLLARTIGLLWEKKPFDATAIHLHHIDPGRDSIHQEIITRLGQQSFQPAISNDVASGTRPRKALAESIDSKDYFGKPPYTAYVARTILMHSLAFNEPLKGLFQKELRYACIGPHIELGFIDKAFESFVADSAYLDDRPGSPWRFRTDSNLHQVIRIEERNVEKGVLRSELDDRVSEIFGGETFDLCKFPAGPYDVPDEVGDGRPKLAVLSYDGVTLGSSEDHVPELIKRIYTRRGAEGASLRILRNNLVFVVAAESRREGMRGKMRRRLALRELVRPERITDLAEHQQEKVRELEGQSEKEVAMAIQNCYCHVFYPSSGQVETREPGLTHSLIEEEASSVRLGSGQQRIVQLLRDRKKLRLSKDDPDSPSWVRDQTPLANGQISTLALRDEFRRAPRLPMLIGDVAFIRGVEDGIEQGEYIYEHEDLLYGPNDPKAQILIDQKATVSTISYAKKMGIWPRKKSESPNGSGPGPGGGGGVDLGQNLRNLVPDSKPRLKRMEFSGKHSPRCGRRHGRFESNRLRPS